jgi:L-asparagine oxygenase
MRDILDALAIATDLLGTAQQRATELPAELEVPLARFIVDPGPTGALRLRGLPVGDVPPTPRTPTDATGKDGTSELSLLSVACRLGHPIGYEPEHGGELVQNILPERANAERQVSTSSAVTLGWHTETAFHPHKPRYLLLLCLRGDAAAVTTLASVADVVPMLDDGTIAVLRQPRVRTRPDESFLAPGSVGELGPPMAVLRGDASHPLLTYDEILMHGVDDEADAALADLTEAVRRAARGLVLEAGDLLVVDNDVAVHGRSPFPARFDGTDRWLQRTFVVSDLDASEHERDGRIITTRF